MGQTLDTITSFVTADDDDELDPDGKMAATNIDEMELHQNIRITGWGKMHHLDLIWSKTDESLHDVRDVVILPDEGIAVSVRDKNHVKRFDRDGNVMVECVGTKYRPLVPSGIACSPHGTILVLCDNEYTKGLREIELDKPYRLIKAHEKLFADSTAIAVVPSSGLSVVAEAGDQNCLNVLREDGTRIRHFGMQHLKHPVGVAIDNMDRIYVTDSEEHSVFVFTLTGDLLFRFGTHGEGDNQFDSPQGICIDPNNNVYIADEMNDRISVYSADGRIKFHLQAEEKISRPRSLALDTFTGRMVVTSKDPQWPRLYVFALREAS